MPARTASGALKLTVRLIPWPHDPTPGTLPKDPGLTTDVAPAQKAEFDDGQRRRAAGLGHVARSLAALRGPECPRGLHPGPKKLA